MCRFPPIVYNALFYKRLYEIYAKDVLKSAHILLRCNPPFSQNFPPISPFAILA